MRSIVSRLGSVAILMALSPSSLPAGEVTANSEPDPTAIAATVNQQPILVSEVARGVKSFVQERPLPPAMLNAVVAQVLEQLIDRQIVLAHLEKNGEGATAAEIDQALTQFKSKLEAQKISFDGMLKSQKTTEVELRRQAAWELSWKKFSEKQATDAALEEYFQANRKQFDGTEVAVSHILLRPERSGDPHGVAPQIEQAQRIRQQILAGKLTFAEAARKYSQGPSAQNGGELGYITRQGIMVEEFSRAAFALDLKGISEPVQTRFGIHLIECTAIKPGTKSWAEVRTQLAAPLAQSLFNRLAQEHRPQSSVVYTGLVPHFKPGTRELMVPKGD